MFWNQALGYLYFLETRGTDIQIIQDMQHIVLITNNFVIHVKTLKIFKNTSFFPILKAVRKWIFKFYPITCLLQCYIGINIYSNFKVLYAIYHMVYKPRYYGKKKCSPKLAVSLVFWAADV